MASNLPAIMTKVRRLTRSPSASQLPDADLIEYINTFVLYDFPEHLRTFNYRETFSWTCNPFQDEYRTDLLSANFPDYQLADFKNKYLTVHPPLYLAGFQQFYTQSREQFFGIYPQVRSIASIGQTGDGVTTQFSGVINANQAILVPGQVTVNTLLQGKVLFSSIDIANQGLAMVDVPVINPSTAELLTQGNLYISGQQPADNPTTVDIFNHIDYVTGQFVVTFPSAPQVGAPINSQTVPSVVGIPQAMLFYDNMFTLRPVPDQPYTINFEVYKRPFALDQTNNPNPDLEEYWQFIALGAARKVLQDRLDLETVALLEPEYREQMRLVLRRTLVQNSNERTATIYTEQTNYSYGNGWGWGGGTF